MAASSSDAFDKLSLHVFYDGEIIKGVEFFRGADVCLHEIPLVARKIGSLLMDLKNNGIEFSEDDEGCVISDFIEIYCPDKQDGVEAYIESVYVRVLN